MPGAPTPDPMRAVRCHRYSGLDAAGKPVPKPDPLRDVLSLDEIAAPACEAGHVLLRTEFAGVQYPDALQAQGLYQHKPALPYVPGMDAAGTVAEVGAGVEHVRPGDRAIVQLGIGCLADVVKAPAMSVWKAPEGVPLERCANLGRNFFPAYHSLKVLGEVGPGSLVLVDGASGGVGMAAIELAKAMGAQVIAGVSTPEKQAPPTAAGRPRALLRARPAELPAVQGRRPGGRGRAGASAGRRRRSRHGAGRAVRGGPGLGHPPPRPHLSRRLHGRAAADPAGPAAHQAGRRHRQHLGRLGQGPPRGAPAQRRRDPRLHGERRDRRRGRIASTPSTASSRPSSSSSATRAAATRWSASPARSPRAAARPAPCLPAPPRPRRRTRPGGRNRQGRRNRRSHRGRPCRWARRSRPRRRTRRVRPRRTCRVRPRRRTCPSLRARAAASC